MHMKSAYSRDSVLHIVHCVDTEGPLTESLEATFDRIESTFGIEIEPTLENLSRLQRKEIDLDGNEHLVAQMVAPNLLDYNNSYEDIGRMLEGCLSGGFRNKVLDDFGGGWVYSWHCMDHMGYLNNPRRKDVGYGNVFRYYRAQLREFGEDYGDEINWHFHPRSITGNPLCPATSFMNSADLLNEILCRRILEDEWFPVVYRPGFHSERPDSHLFLEQWIPFDYANQYHEDGDDQPDISNGRFGDWRRSSSSWCGYHPDHDDYQVSGGCRRMIFRCLNVGTRARQLKINHIHEAFSDATDNGVAILAFADHDYRDIRPDVDSVRRMLYDVRRKYPDVKIKFSGAESAARDLVGVDSNGEIKLRMSLDGNILSVWIDSGVLFGPQPYLAIGCHDGRVFHDNFDVQVPGKEWRYILDDLTMPLNAISSIGAGGAGRRGGYDVVVLSI